jgi:hypothetical protein
MFWFIVLLLVVGAGFYFYQKLISIEQEIHAEQEAYSAALQKAEKTPGEVPTAKEADLEEEELDPEAASPAVTSEPSEPISLAEMICAEVNKQTGIKQTDLYPMFATTNKKQLQRLIKELADDGRLRREKRGSSYLLYPL